MSVVARQYQDLFQVERRSTRAASSAMDRVREIIIFEEKMRCDSCSSAEAAGDAVIPQPPASAYYKLAAVTAGETRVLSSWLTKFVLT